MRSAASTNRSEGSHTSYSTDAEYPGTAVRRMLNVRRRVFELAQSDALNQRWEEVRRSLLWAGGLKDVIDAIPGYGYTGHHFNDFNHVDLTCITEGMFDAENHGMVDGIMEGNNLGVGIRRSSLSECGPGGSWALCSLGCHIEPPQDVAHLQFESRIAFKLVWVPNDRFDTFVLVDDEGNFLALGKPSDGPAGLPDLQERILNYRMVQHSKYAKVAQALARNVAVE